MQIALYKGEGTLFDKFVRYYTSSKYSHIELVIEGQCYSSSIRDDGVRCKIINLNSGNWDVYELCNINTDSIDILEFFDRTKDLKYDLFGVLVGQLFNTNWHSKNKYFCSEWFAEALGISTPNALNPEEVLQQLIKDNKVII